MNVKGYVETRGVLITGVGDLIHIYYYKIIVYTFTFIVFTFVHEPRMIAKKSIDFGTIKVWGIDDQDSIKVWNTSASLFVAGDWTSFVDFFLFFSSCFLLFFHFVFLFFCFQAQKAVQDSMLNDVSSSLGVMKNIALEMGGEMDRWVIRSLPRQHPQIRYHVSLPHSPTHVT